MKIKVCVALCLMAICMVSGSPSEYIKYKTKNFNDNIESEFSSPSSPRNKRTIGIFTSFLNAFTNSLQRSNPPPPPPPPPPARPAPRNNNNANIIGYNVFAGVQPITGAISANPLPIPTPAPSAPAAMGAAAAPPPPPTRPMAPPPPPLPLGPSIVNIPIAIAPAPPAPAPTAMPVPPPTTMAPPPPTMAAAPPPTTGAPPTTTDLLPGGEETTLGGDSAQSTTFGDEGDDDYNDSSTEVEDDNAISPKAAARTQSSSSSSEFDPLYNNNNYWINPSPPAWFRSGSLYSDSREEDTDSSNGVQTFGVKYSEPIRQQHNKHDRNYNTKPNGRNQFQQQQYSQPQQYQQFKSANYEPYIVSGGTSGSATTGDSGYEFNVPGFSTQPEYTMPASHSRVKMHDNGFDQFTYHDHRLGAQPSYRIEYHGKRDWA